MLTRPAVARLAAIAVVLGALVPGGAPANAREEAVSAEARSVVLNEVVLGETTVVEVVAPRGTATAGLGLALVAWDDPARDDPGGDVVASTVLDAADDAGFVLGRLTATTRLPAGGWSVVLTSSPMDVGWAVATADGAMVGIGTPGPVEVLDLVSVAPTTGGAAAPVVVVADGLPAGLARIPDGRDTDGADDWVVVGGFAHAAVVTLGGPNALDDPDELDGEEPVAPADAAMDAVARESLAVPESESPSPTATPTPPQSSAPPSSAPPSSAPSPTAPSPAPTSPTTPPAATPSPASPPGATGAPSPTAPPEARTVLNEISASTIGPDVEYVEVLGGPGADLSSLTVLQVEGDVDSPWIGEVVSQHPVGAPDGDGRWTVELEGVLQNGSMTVLLVRGWTGAVDAGSDLGAVVDAVGFDDGDPGDVVVADMVMTADLPGVDFVPGGVSRIPDGADTASIADWRANDYELAGIDGHVGSPNEHEARNTPGATNEMAMGEIPPPDADGTVSTDHVWSWWLEPVASHADGVSWVGGLSMDGDVQVLRRPDGQRAETIVLARHQVDDHNAPAVLARPGKPTVVAWTQHGLTPWVTMRSEEDVGSGTFGPARRLELPYTTTYVQLVEADSRIVLVTRASSKRWFLATSDDDGVTWSPPQPFYEDMRTGHSYMLLRPGPDEGVLQFVLTKHPRSTDTSIVHGFLDVASGDVTSTSGRVVASLASGEGLPLARSDLEVVAAVSGSSTSRLLDLGTMNGRPVVVHAVWPTGTPSAATYLASQRVGGGWAVAELGPSGGSFGGHDHYLGGAAIVGDAIVAASESGGAWQLRQFDRTGPWEFTPGAVLQSSESPVVRPVHVRTTHDYAVHELSDYEFYNAYRARTIMGTTAPEARDPAPELVDTAWSWWSRPVTSRADGTTWVGGVTSDGDVQVARWQDSGATGTTLLGTGGRDLDAPAVLARAGRPTVVAWSTGDDVVRHRVETAVGSGEFGPVRQLRLPGRTSFVQIEQLGDDLHLVTRVGSKSWYWSRSDDDGATWSTPRVIFRERSPGPAYVLLSGKPDGKVLRFVLTRHPDRPDNAVGYAYIAVQRDVVRVPGGRVVADLATGEGLPLSMSSVPWPIDPAPGWSIRVLDLGDVAGRPVMLYAVWKADAPETVGYAARVWNGRRWTRVDLGRDGASFADHASFVGGAALVAGGVVVSEHRDGRWRVRHAAWTSPTTVATTGDLADSRNPLVLPRATLGSADLAVLELAGQDWSTRNHDGWVRRLSTP